MLSIKEAKAIAAPFIGIELHWDRQQHLWVLTDRKNEAPSNWINSGHLKSMKPEYWLEYCESYAGEVAEHHGDDILSDTGEAAEHTCEGYTDAQKEADKEREKYLLPGDLS